MYNLDEIYGIICYTKFEKEYEKETIPFCG